MSRLCSIKLFLLIPQNVSKAYDYMKLSVDDRRQIWETYKYQEDIRPGYDHE